MALPNFANVVASVLNEQANFLVGRRGDGWECSLHWSIAAGNMLVAHQLALAGQGIALLPDFLIAEDVNNGSLQPVLRDFWEDAADAWLVSSRQRYRSPAVRKVLETLTSGKLSEANA